MGLRLIRAFRPSAAPRRAWRYGLVGALAFMLGSATIVTAATTLVPVGSLFFISTLNGSPTSPCSTFAAEGKTTTTCFAVVNSKGELATTDADTHAILNQMRFGSDGSLKVSSQGTSSVSGNVAVTSGHINVDNFPATQPVSGSVSVSNMPASQAVTGTVAVSNLPADQAVHGTVTVTNIPASLSGGVTRIDLPTHPGVASGARTHWVDVDVSSCRGFAVWVVGDADRAPNIGILNGPVTAPVLQWFRPDLMQKDGYREQWAFPVQPFSTQPWYATIVDIEAENRGSAATDLAGYIYCQH